MIKSVLVPILGVAAVVLALSAVPAGAQEFETVQMTFAGGDACVSLDKPRATIFRDKNPKKVMWQVPENGRYWEMRYDEGKPGAVDDYLKNSGKLDIKCSQTNKNSVTPNKFIPEGATWPYKILVYQCDGNHKGALLCELDPNIDWGDG